MASLTVNVQGRVRGMWRARLAAWLNELLLPGVRVEYRVDNGTWLDIPVGWHVEMILDRRDDDADGDGHIEEVALSEAVDLIAGARP